METAFNKGDKVRIDAGTRGSFDGVVSNSYLANQTNELDDDNLTFAVFTVEFNNGEVDTRTRFYQRRSGAVFQSQGWNLRRV